MKARATGTRASTRAALAAAIAIGVAGTAPAAAAPEKPVTVKVGNNFYGPDEVRIHRGSTIRFRWAGGVPHNVTYDHGPGKVFRSPTSSDAGVNFRRTFASSGRFQLHCTIHPDEMKLTVRVR